MNLVEVLEISGEASRQYPSTLRRWRRAPPEKAGAGILSARVCGHNSHRAFPPESDRAWGSMGWGGHGGAMGGGGLQNGLINGARHPSCTSSD